MVISLMSKPKVCIYIPIDSSGESHRRIEEAGCEVILGETSWRTGIDRDALLELSRGAHALLGATIKRMPIEEIFLKQLPELRIISKYTIGVEDVDLNAASEQGVLVTHSPTEANWGGVAEGTIAFMLTLLKRVRERDRHVKQGGWRDSALMGTYLGKRQDGYPGLTVGIVGFGRCGSRVAELLAPWNLRVLACDPYVEDEKFERYGVRRATLASLLEESDVVTLHVTLTEETHNLIGSMELKLMKSTAILINTCRGAVVDIGALCDALDGEELAAAAVDVLSEEPPPTNSRILSLGDKVILCPHMVSANTPGTLLPAIPWATDATLAALRGEVPEHVYNIDAIPRWLDRFGDKPLI
jgi:phosphoglycerate dehydrogenase-like enzyme